MIKFTLLVMACLFCSIVAAMPPVPVIPSFPVVASNNHTFHVNKELGDDSTNDGTLAHPWKTFKFAAGNLRAGDTLIVHGTSTAYTMNWTSLVHSGDEKQWITIKGVNGVNGERVIFTGRLLFGDKARASVSYVNLENVFFQGPGDGGLNIFVNTGSHHLVFQDMEIDCQSSPENRRGLWTENNVSYIWFRNLDVHHCGFLRNPPKQPPPPGWKAPTDCGGICVKGDKVDNVVFLDVRVADNVGDGIGGGSKKAYGSSYFRNCISERNSGDGFDPGGALTVIINSISRNNGGHQGAGFKFWSNESWLVNSVSYNNDSVGVFVRPRGDGDSHAYIFNNTFALNSVNRYGGQISTAPKDPANGKLYFYIHNNIFHTLNTSAIVISNNGTQLIEEESHNYYFSVYDSSRRPHWTYAHAIHFRDGNMKVADGYTFTDMSAKGRWSIDTGNGAGNLGKTATAGELDPGFVDLENGDLRLTRGSQAIDTGVDVGIASDIAGTRVPTGRAPDMGAYEFTGHGIVGLTPGFLY